MARTKGAAAVYLLQLRKGMVGTKQPSIPPPPGTPREYPTVYRVELNDLESYLVNSLQGAT